MIVCLSARVPDADLNSVVMMITWHKSPLRVLGCVPQRCSTPVSPRCLITHVLNKDMFRGAEFVTGTDSLKVFSPLLDLIASSKSLYFEATGAVTFPRTNHRGQGFNKSET